MRYDHGSSVNTKERNERRRNGERKARRWSDHIAGVGLHHTVIILAGDRLRRVYIALSNILKTYASSQTAFPLASTQREE